MLGHQDHPISNELQSVIGIEFKPKLFNEKSSLNGNAAAE